MSKDIVAMSFTISIIEEMIRLGFLQFTKKYDDLVDRIMIKGEEK